jgi:hypothetical protein
MKYFDFAIQTLLMLIAVTLLASTFHESDCPLNILIVQLFLGPWQLLSSLFSVLAKSRLYMRKRAHLLLSLAYLVIIWMANDYTDPFPKWVLNFALIVPAWCLALYYYYLSYHAAFDEGRKGSSFLRHISF